VGLEGIMPFKTIYTDSSVPLGVQPIDWQLTEEQYRIHLKKTWNLSEEKIDAIVRVDPRYANYKRDSEFFTEKQRQDIAFFEENIETWANNPLYRFKFFVISGKEIRGFYDTFEAALQFAAWNFGTGEYIIQQILPKDEGYFSLIA
jgi:hypothetical protein